ncbi:MAG TPA: alpha/beta fold hydrolase [Arenimonas sp.]|nr:alpha/beta fold hydrolase [Arenimonas sp.]
MVLAASVGIALGTLGFAASAPERLLEAEFARQRWLAGAQVMATDAADHRWSYLEAGSAQQPLIVLVHGFTGSKENWLPLMRALSGSYRIIAPDLPGWGASERQPGADYGPIAQSERLAAFLRRLPEPPAMLIGHSMGGQIAGLASAAHPGLVPRLGLLASAGVRFRDNAFGAAVLAGDNPFEVTNRAELRRYLGIVFADPPFVPWPVDTALVRRRRADAAFEQSVLDGIGRGPEAFALQESLPQIAAPTLLLWCRDDRVIDVSAMDIFREGLPLSRSVLLAGCGHMPMMAQPELVAEMVARFLNDLPLRPGG